MKSLERIIALNDSTMTHQKQQREGGEKMKKIMLALAALVTLTSPAFAAGSVGTNGFEVCYHINFQASDGSWVDYWDCHPTDGSW